MSKSESWGRGGRSCFLAIVAVIPRDRGFWKRGWGSENSRPEMVRYTDLERGIELMYIIHELREEKHGSASYDKLNCASARAVGKGTERG
jgi:hypothetical protein